MKEWNLNDLYTGYDSEAFCGIGINDGPAAVDYQAASAVHAILADFFQ